MGSAVVREAAAQCSSLHCSALGRVELVSMLTRACRDKRLTPRAMRDALDQYDDDNGAVVWDWIPVAPAVIEDARRRLEAIGTRFALSGADAVHLSTARLSGFDEIWTADRRMIAAAASFDLKARDPLS